MTTLSHWATHFGAVGGVMLTASAALAECPNSCPLGHKLN